MRADTVTFNSANTAPQKSPRFVVGIIFDVASIYITSHTGITTVPGVVIDGALRNPSALSQKIVPDEGRTEIGAMSFDLVDLESQFTDEVRSKLGDGKGLRGKEVRLYVGYEGMDFTAFQLFQTQVVSEASFDDGVYTVQCRDITREERKEIFEPKRTTLRDSVSDTATTIPVYVTTGFSTVFHGPSYSDGPSSTVGYIKIDDEIIRYTGKTADSFTGCTRGVLNTRAVAHEVDSGTDADRRPKVEEYVYLELPAAKLIYAILTGELYNDAATLPTHWNLGIDTSWVRLSDFTGLGEDLWDTTLDTAGFITRFAGLTKTDGKKFLETELYQLLGCMPIIYSDGTIGIKRMNHVLADAPYVAVLSEKNCVSWSGLKHEMNGMHNVFRVNWNHDGEEFTRSKLFIDAASVSAYGQAPIKELNFKGLHGARHTDAIVAKRIDALRDRYTYPPETMEITVLPSLNRLEVGDIVRPRLINVRDFAGDGLSIPANLAPNPSFEIDSNSNSIPDDWEDTAIGTGSTRTNTRVASPVVEGSWAHRLNFTSITPPTSVSVHFLVSSVASAVPVTAGQVYTASVYGQTSTLTYGSRIQIDWRDSGGSTISSSFADHTFSGTSSFERFSVTATAPVGAVTVRLRMGIVRPNVNDTTLGNIVWDCFQFENGAVASGWTAASTRVIGGSIDRSFEIQQKSEDFATGNVRLSLFGSTGRASVDAPTADTSPLPDAYYTAQGVNLNTVCTIVDVGGVGVIQPGTYNLTGNADMTASGAVYYYPGDLELADGATLTINNNVQIRVRGFFTVNGDIDGIGRGKAGQADNATFGTVVQGLPGFIGNSRGMDGARGRPLPRGGHYIQTVPCAFTQGANTAFPYLELTVSGTTLVGIPSDLRGTSGGAGGKITRVAADGSGGTTSVVGGTGGDSGAGLAIICRGLAVGASGSINLSGDDAASTSISNSGIGFTWQTYPGAGGAGSPGGFLLLLDGSGISIPDLSGGGFIAACGTVPVNGTPMPQRGEAGFGDMKNGGWTEPAAGYLDESLISAVDLSNVAHRIQYVPETQTPAEDEDDLPPAPTSLSVNPGQLENVLTIGMPPAGTFDVIEIYAALTNDRTGAVLVDSVGGSVYRHQLTGGVTRFYWVRARRGAITSAFLPSSSTGGISGTVFARFVARGNCEIIGDVGRKVGGSAAYDSDIYSPDQYINGCFVTWRCDQTNLEVFVGLNSDPTTDQTYTGLDYCIYCNASGQSYIYQSNTLILALGSYTTATVFTITHDGKLIKYFKSGALVHQAAVQNATLFMDSSFHGPGAQISALQFGPLNAVTPSPWVARGNCLAGLTTARKTAGTAAWDSDIYSIDSYPICHLKFKPNQTTAALVIGFSTNPITDLANNAIPYAWELDASGNLFYKESGTSTSAGAAYTTSTELAMTYDFSNVRYYKDRVLVRTQAIASQVFFLDSSFHTVGAAVNTLHFGPGTALEAVGTPGIEPEAATEVYETTVSSTTIVAPYSGVLLVIGDYGEDVELAVSSSGRYVMNISAAAACQLRGAIGSAATAPVSTELIASNHGNATGNVSGFFTLEKRFTHTPSLVSYYLKLEPIFPAPANVGSSVDLYDIRHKVEVIKR